MRGGDPCADGQFERMIKSARTSYDEGEGYALSTYGGYDPSKSREELIAEVARVCHLPHAQVAVTTARKVTEAGFRLVPDGELPGHVNIDLGSELTDEVVKRFVGMFDPAEDNPGRPETRKGR